MPRRHRDRNTSAGLSHLAGTHALSLGEPLTYISAMTHARIGYARCSTDKLDLTAGLIGGLKRAGGAGAERRDGPPPDGEAALRLAGSRTGNLVAVWSGHEAKEQG